MFSYKACKHPPALIFQFLILTQMAISLKAANTVMRIRTRKRKFRKKSTTTYRLTIK